MGKKNKDYCHICGEYTNLTFEHIPPKKAGNQTKVNEINGDVLIESLTDHKRLPWDFKGLKYKQKQKGMGLYSLCSSCNNNTGAWYGEDYIIFSNTMAKLLTDEKPQPNTGIKFEVDIKPLNILKQILSFFCSINKYPLNDQIAEFILDKESLDFNDEEYILTMFLYIGTIEKYIGTVGKLSVSTNTKSGWETTLVSEVCTYPLGFCLYKKTENMGDIIGTDISSFSKCSYGEIYTTQLLLPIFTSNTMFPNDYRLKSNFIM